MSERIERHRIVVRGVVQGVGFRPFVFHLATNSGLSGNVYNDSGGVYIEVEGQSSAIQDFIGRLKDEAPPLARIQSIQSQKIPTQGQTGFEILISHDRQNRSTLIPPDIAICRDCRRELFDPKDRRYRYPFINCTNCGPRFTIVREIPYDRPKTTMQGFEMCEDCLREYENPGDRRFHAQPNACPVCGPKIWLADSDLNPIPAEDTIEEASRQLRQGRILALKGMGGFHLACLATDKKAVGELRGRKRRIQKPFALMVKDLETARKLCEVSPEEARLLQSYAAPIVLLRRKIDCPVAREVAPGLDDLGIMLPYTPLHLLLLETVDAPLVMTSANFSEEPIAYREERDRKTLSSLADLLLLHDREIHMRCDDSVCRVSLKRERVVRRSRGFTPLPIVLALKAPKPILACGAMLKNTFCLAKEDQYLLSHHIGDLENLETLQSFESGIEHFEQLFRCEPEILVCDLHPDYLSSRYAEKRMGEKRLQLQHHKAHIASCLADNNFFEPVIGVAWDGLGYGEDGKIWGGEFFIGDLHELNRIGNLKEVPQPGGDAATREPWRMALSHLHQVFGSNWRKEVPKNRSPWPYRPVEIVESLLTDSSHLPHTTSMGRLFDAVSALVLGIEQINYEGQAAIYLEAHARQALNLGQAYPLTIVWTRDRFELSPDWMFRRILEDLRSGVHPDEMAYRFHRGLAKTLVDACQTIQERYGLSTVALSGGVFQNALLLELTVQMLEDAALQVLTHSQVPTNDGGIALGQAAWAAVNGQM